MASLPQITGPLPVPQIAGPNTPVEILVALYPRLNNNASEACSHVQPNLVPPGGHLARVVADLTHALTTFASMTARNNLEWRLPPPPTHPDYELINRVRSKWYFVLFFATQLEKKFKEAFGGAGAGAGGLGKSEEEMRVIRSQLGGHFGPLGRMCTAEVWQWIQLMTAKGYGQMLE